MPRLNKQMITQRTTIGNLCTKLGVTRYQMSKWFSGKERPTCWQLVRIGALLRVNPITLLIR